MKAADVMTKAVISIPSDGTVEEAVRVMLEHHVSALPVIDADGKLVGLVSEGDLMRRIEKPQSARRSWWLELLEGSGDSARDFVKLRSHHVADVMTRDVITAQEETTVAEVARLLEKHHIKRVPVVKDARVVGIVSRANLLHALSSAEDGRVPNPSNDDRALRGQIEKALKEVPGVAANLLNLTVNAGAVSVWGVVGDETEIGAIRVAVENVPGVRSVEMHVGRLPAWAYGI